MYKYTLPLSFDSSTSHGVIVRMIPDGSNILEFGCSDGQLARYVKDNKSCTVFGIDISNEAVKAAMPYLSGGLVADIERDGWEEKLSGMEFDVILFSDVLEHLKNPEEVLKKAVNFLKPDGRVIFSIPNIAHGDIILKLLNQRFDYSELGLLDNTHIHFFGKKNLTEFCENSGLFLKDLFATYAAVNTTEQKDEGASEFDKNFVASHDYTNVYQFVCLAYKQAYAVEKTMEFCDGVKACEESITVFFDMGDGFSAENREAFSSSGEIENFTVKIPSGTKALRFDVRDGAFYVMENAKFYFDGVEAFPTNIVNMEKASDTYIITAPDPQQIFAVPDGAREFKAIADVFPLFNEKNINEYIKKAIQNSKSLIEKEDALNATASELEASRAELNLTKTVLAAAEQEATLTKEMLATAKEELVSTQEELVSVNENLEASNAALNSTRQILEKTTIELDAKKQEIDNMNPKLDKISENVNNICDKFECLEKKLNKNSSELNEKLVLLTTLSEKVNSLTLELEGKNNALEKLSADFEKVSNDLNACREENADLKSVLGEKNVEYKFLSDKSEEISKELDHYKTHYFAAIHQRTELRARVADLEAMYSCISRSACWRITKPLRVVLDLIKRPLRKIKFLALVRKGIRCYRENGFKYTWKKFKEKISGKTKNQISSLRPLYTEEELEAQKQEKFTKNIKFSVVVPLYNTPEKYLIEMIDSVVAQTYSNWELCMADGSDNKHKYVESICKKYSKHEERIKYKKLEKNLGISGNTNACINMATGDYISLFDHDDLLHPAALYENMKVICEKDADFIYTDENTFSKTPEDAYCPHFKPDYAPDTLRTNNYICHFTTFKKSLLDKVGMFRPECDGSQDYDMVLRLTEQAQNIVHIPKILYYWRAHAASVATDVSAKPYVIEAAHKALRDHLERVGLDGEVKNTVVPSMYRIKYEIKKESLVSIIIANKDHIDDLDKCINSIVSKTTYKNYEIIVVENNSEEQTTWEYYKHAIKEYGIKLVEWKPEIPEFNYSAINNFGVENSSGEYVILLNNDTEILSEEWIEEMLMFAQRDDIGAVGAKLYYPDDTIQHAGIGMGLLTLAGHYHKNFPKGHPGYMGRLIYAHNVSAVTAACVMIPRKVWNEVGGLDESFKVAFNDVDLCMRIRKAGYLIVFTPFSELYHYESKSRGLDSAPEKRERFVDEVTRFQKRWREVLDAGDPYYNPNFSLDKEDFTIKTQ